MNGLKLILSIEHFFHKKGILHMFGEGGSRLYNDGIGIKQVNK